MRYLVYEENGKKTLIVWENVPGEPEITHPTFAKQHKIPLDKVSSGGYICYSKGAWFLENSQSWQEKKSVAKDHRLVMCYIQEHLTHNKKMKLRLETEWEKRKQTISTSNSFADNALTILLAQNVHGC